jgi:hypothetical protein
MDDAQLVRIDSYTTAMEGMSGSLDPVDVCGAVLIVSDALDLDPVAILDHQLGGPQIFMGHEEQVIMDLIETSQSDQSDDALIKIRQALHIDAWLIEQGG